MFERQLLWFNAAFGKSLFQTISFGTLQYIKYFHFQIEYSFWEGFIDKHF